LRRCTPSCFFQSSGAHMFGWGWRFVWPSPRSSVDDSYVGSVQQDGSANGSQPFCSGDKSNVIGGWLPSLTLSGTTPMKLVSFVWVLAGFLLATGCDKTGGVAPNITRSIPGAWQAIKVKQGATERTIYSLSLDQSTDYSRISTPGDVNSSDPLVVLEGLIYCWKSARPQQVKTYFASEDGLQQIDPGRLSQILGRPTGREDWRMTHLVCYGEVVIVRGSFLDNVKSTREIDLWPLTQIHGTWRAHALSPEAKSVEWLMKLLYQDAVTLSS